MTTVSKPKSVSPLRGIRWALGIGGLIAVIVGILIVVWPDKSGIATAAAITVIIAVYAIVAGLVYIGVGIMSKTRGTWRRVSNALLGVLFIVAAVIAFANLGAAAVVLAAVVGMVVGIMWIIEGAVALIALGRSVEGEAQVWGVIFAVVSIIAGITIIFAPLFAVTVLWFFMGIALIVQGLFQIVRAVRAGRRAA